MISNLNSLAHRLRASTALMLVLLTTVACAKQDEKTDDSSTDSKYTQETSMVTMQTSLGNIQIELDADNAPQTTANFLAYVARGHYDGTIFHRVIKNFMVQGGGFEPGMSQKPTAEPIANEANNGLVNARYTIAMARTNDPHSATAQFFINTKDNDFLNFSSETPSGWGYAVFGKVVAGHEVVDAIENVATGQRGPYGDVPADDVLIESISVDAD